MVWGFDPSLSCIMYPKESEYLFTIMADCQKGTRPSMLATKQQNYN